MKSYYLFIAVNDYEDEKWDTLEGPVNDLTALQKILEEKYGFERLDFLKDEKANSDAIRDWVTYMASANRIEEDAQLLIYFSCHGIPWRHTGQQYWIAHNGTHYKRETRKKEGWIDSEEVIGAFRAIPCRHILLVSDACFSGRLLEKYDHESHVAKFTLWPAPQNPHEVALKRTSRELLTSCLDEPVIDALKDGYSPFAKELMSILKENEAPVLSVVDILPALKRRIHRECTPARGTLGNGHQSGGRFLFFNRKAGNENSEQSYQSAPPHSASKKPTPKPTPFRKRKAVRLLAYSSLLSFLACVSIATYQAYLQTPLGHDLSTDSRSFSNSLIFFLFATFAGFVKRKIKWACDLSPMLCGLTMMGVLFVWMAVLVGVLWIRGAIPQEHLLALSVADLCILLMAPIIGSWMQFGHDLSVFRPIFLKRHSQSIVKFFLISCAVWAIPMVGFFFVSKSNGTAQNLLIVSGVCLVLAWILLPFFWSFFMAKRGLLSTTVFGAGTPLLSLFVVMGIACLFVPEPISSSSRGWLMFPVVLLFVLSSSAGIGASLGGLRNRWRTRSRS